MNSQKIVEEINEPRTGMESSSGESIEDEEEEDMPDYVDKAGRRWHFLCHAKEDLAQFVQQNGLVPGNENGKRRKFGCARPECHFRAVFLKVNSGIYTRGEHWHEQVDGIEANVNKIDKTETSKVIPKRGNERLICSLSTRTKIVCRNKEEFLINQKGLVFRLICRFETDNEFEEYRQKIWLMKNGIDKSYTDRIYLYCRRHHSNQTKQSTNCLVTGVYVKQNRSLYQNNQQHNHPMGREDEDHFSRFLSQNAVNKKVDYVDYSGKHWHFLRQINNLEELEKFTKKLYLDSRGNGKIFYFVCKYASYTTLKRHPYPPPYCQMRAIFIKATSSIYVRNEHSHHPPFKLKSMSNIWSHHGQMHRIFAKYEKDKNIENGQGNAEEQNGPTPKKEAALNLNGEEEGEEVRIVKHLQRDYKCLGRMKREGAEEGQSRTMDLPVPVQTIQLGGEEDDLEEGTSQGTRRKGRGTFYRYTQRELQRPIIKKEEPEEEAEAAPLPVPQPQLPANIAWVQQFAVARPTKMLLRERKKRINYGE